jgi:hypothetical protein
LIFADWFVWLRHAGVEPFEVTLAPDTNSRFAAVRADERKAPTTKWKLRIS